MNLPSPETFDYRDKAQFEQVYQQLGSCQAVSDYLAQAGRELSRSGVNIWRTRHGVDVAQDAYRLRGAVAEGAPADGALADSLKHHLKRCRTSRTVEQLSDHFGLPPREIRAALAVLEESATLIEVVDDTVTLESDLQMHEAPQRIDMSKYAETEIAFGWTADNHLGSKYERLDVLEALFDRYEAEGVKTVYQGGNILDGEATFNKFDIYARGVEEQVANLIEKWPRREGIITYFVTGDDHEGWYVQREHLNIGEKIEHDAYRAGRDDLRHLGYMERDIAYEQPGGSARIRVIHAGGGSAYATSYTSQKYVETLQGGDKPQIVLVGHFHKFDYSYPREVHVIQMGATQDQTPFMRKRRLQSHVGGGIAWVKQNTLGIFTSVKVEWIPFFDRRFYEYRW